MFNNHIGVHSIPQTNIFININNFVNNFFKNFVLSNKFKCSYYNHYKIDKILLILNLSFKIFNVILFKSPEKYFQK